jgi:hypothetical protein
LLWCRYSGQEIVVTAMTDQPLPTPDPIFDDRDRARALGRLEAIDGLGARRLVDALWPDDDTARATARLADAIEHPEPRR